MNLSQIIEEVKNRVDIVEVISEYLPLKKVGSNYKILCPFHREKTPSFIVNPQKQIFKCFGCGIGGNAITFLQKQENINFQEAVLLLAKKYGIKVDNEFKSHPKIEIFYEINQKAMEFFKALLYKNKAVLYYLITERHLTEKIIDKFNIGYADSNFSLISYLYPRYSQEDLYEVGLLTKRNNVYFEIFKDRIIFPILDIKNRVIGFGGRIVKDKEKEDIPKYINTPQTPIYKKGKNLYALNLAADYISKEKKALLVEGYLDAVVLHMSGFNNTVAVLGTALTQEQVLQLKRYANEVVLLFDQDTAGKKATLLGLNALLEFGIEAKVGIFEKGYDPAEYLIEKGSFSMQKAIDNAEELLSYRLNSALESYNVKSIYGKKQVILDLLDVITVIKEPIRKAEFITRVANALNLSEQVIIDEVKFLRQKTKIPGIIDIDSTRGVSLSDEEILFKLVLENKDINIKKILIQLIENPDILNDENIKEIFLVMKEHVDEELEPFDLMNFLTEPAQILLSKILLTEDSKINNKKDLKLKHYLLNIVLKNLIHKRRELEKSIEVGDISSDEKRYNLYLLCNYKKKEEMLKNLKLQDLEKTSIEELLKNFKNMI